MKMRNLLNLFRNDKKRPSLWGGGISRAWARLVHLWGCQPWCATWLLLLRGAFRDCSAERLDCWFWKVLCLGLLVGQSRKTTTLLAFLAWLWQVAPIYLVDGKNVELQALSTSWPMPLGVSDVLSMLGYVVAQMEQREDFLGKEGARQGRLGLRLMWGGHSLAGRHRWARGYCGFWAR